LRERAKALCPMFQPGAIAVEKCESLRDLVGHPHTRAGRGAVFRHAAGRILAWILRCVDGPLTLWGKALKASPFEPLPIL
jgi:hypothetical protein